ncbi:hypothetical protein COCSADRAFT_41795, partial [Bipolaris sorokiniana ND90Pr]
MGFAVFFLFCFFVGLSLSLFCHGLFECALMLHNLHAFCVWQLPFCGCLCFAGKLGWRPLSFISRPRKNA